MLGWSALSGVVVVLVAYTLNYPLAKYNIWVSCSTGHARHEITYFDPNQVTRSSWKARDIRMNVVNELLQSIRFLKYYGWGMYICIIRLIPNLICCIENFWADKARKSRENELKWRVKENVVNTMIAFIW